MQRIKELERIKEENLGAFKVIASYLNEFPCLVTKEIMDEIISDTELDCESYFALFLSLALSENDESGDALNKLYLKKSVKRLDTKQYKENPYYKNIKIPQKRVGRWELGYQSYKPYEGFVYDDIEVEKSYREIPKIGFFTEEFSFPTVYEDGVEWMAIKPNEIETMKPHIEKMSGNVVVFGLGLGYFAYMISQKESVKSITIVERDSSVIKLFEENILPQFENKHKIKIVKSDAFDFAENELPKINCNHAFVDLWHDVSDGVELYIKMKKLEAKNSKTQFSYWIEKSILSSIRWQIFDSIQTQIKNGKFSEPYENILKYISDDYLKNFVKFI